MCILIVRFGALDVRRAYFLRIGIAMIGTFLRVQFDELREVAGVVQPGGEWPIRTAGIHRCLSGSAEDRSRPLVLSSRYRSLWLGHVAVFAVAIRSRHVQRAAKEGHTARTFSNKKAGS